MMMWRELLPSCAVALTVAASTVTTMPAATLLVAIVVIIIVVVIIPGQVAAAAACTSSLLVLLLLAHASAGTAPSALPVLALGGGRRQLHVGWAGRIKKGWLR